SFNRQSGSGAIEVENVRPHRMLAAETDAVELSTARFLPHHHLRRGHRRQSCRTRSIATAGAHIVPTRGRRGVPPPPPSPVPPPRFTPASRTFRRGGICRRGSRRPDHLRPPARKIPT